MLEQAKQFRRAAEKSAGGVAGGGGLSVSYTQRFLEPQHKQWLEKKYAYEYR